MEHERDFYPGIDAEVLVSDIEEQVNRIARDLAQETGQPLQEWLVNVSRLVAPSLRYSIREVDGSHVYVIDRAQGRRPGTLGGWRGATLA